MRWEIEGTDAFREWYDGLSDDDEVLVAIAISALEEVGPALGRPFVDTLKTPLISNLKELRPRRTTIRILFVFDPRRTAILLLGGDKAGEWDAWYQRMIPVAVRLYSEYLNELREEGLIE